MSGGFLPPRSPSVRRLLVLYCEAPGFVVRTGPRPERVGVFPVGFRMSLPVDVTLLRSCPAVVLSAAPFFPKLSLSLVTPWKEDRRVLATGPLQSR